MLINEVAKLCNLTKKAISYYEQEGLLQPKHAPNGYRDYDENDVNILKEITIFRNIGMSVSEIKLIFSSEDKHKALQDYQLKKEFKMNQIEAQYKYLKYLLDCKPTVEEAFTEMEHKLDDYLLIKDKLLAVFPGYYGKYLVFHFGKFLNEKIDSNEKRIAYNRIVQFFDDIEDLEIPNELQQYLQEVTDSLSEDDIKEMNAGFLTTINDVDSFIEHHKDSIEAYLSYRNSAEYQSSFAYKLQQVMLDFQKSNGYYDIFIANLKILSKSYCEYLEKLHKGNEHFLSQF